MKILFHRPFLIKHIIIIYVGCVGQPGFSDMGSYLQWECYVEAPSTSIHFTISVPNKNVSQIFCDLLLVNG
jgi:hypothetical protein